MAKRKYAFSDLAQVENSKKILKIQERPKNLDSLNSLVNLTKNLISARNFEPETLLNVVWNLHNIILDLPESKVKDNISELLEKWWDLNLENKEEIIEYVLKYLIQKSKTSLEHIKRLNNIKSALTIIKKPADVQELLKLVQEKIAITNNFGKSIIVQIFHLEESFVSDLQSHVQSIFVSCDSETLKAFAEIYLEAWTKAPENIRTLISTQCMRSFIFQCLRSKRDSEGRDDLGKKLLEFLSLLHFPGNVPFSEMLRQELDQSLWEHLQAPGSSVRCNAAEVLFVIYPIFAVNDERKKNDYVSKLHGAISNLLEDSNEKVCIIAVKGVYDLLDSESMTEKIFEDCINSSINLTQTSGDPEIRKLMFSGLIKMLENPKALEKLKLSLKKLSCSILDPSNGVKTEFFNLLFSLQKKMTNFWDFFPLITVLNSLEVTKNNKILELHVKLLGNSIISKKDEKSITKELLLMWKSSESAMKKMFSCCNEIIDCHVAFKLIKAMMNYVLEQIQSEESYKNAKSKKEVKNTVDFESLDFLFQICNELLVANKKKIKKDGKDLEKMKNFTEENISGYVEYIQKSPNSESAIVFFSSLPGNMLNNEILLNSLTTKLQKPESSDEEISETLSAMVQLKKCEHAIELVMKLLNSDSVENCDKKQGLRICDSLFSEKLFPYIQKKHEKSIRKMRKSFDFVVNIIEETINNDSKFEPLDEKEVERIFQHRIFLLLQMEEDPFELSEKFLQMVKWISRVIVPESTKPENTTNRDFSRQILKIVFETGNEMIRRNLATPKTCCEIVVLHCKSLSSLDDIKFISISLATILELLEYEKLNFKHEKSYDFSSKIVPNLFATIMVVSANLLKDKESQHLEDLENLISAIPRIFAVLNRPNDNENSEFNVYMSIVFNSAVACTSEMLLQQIQDDALVVENEINLPLLAGKLLDVISKDAEFQDLCLEVVRDISYNSQIDELSSLILLHELKKVIPKKNAKTIKQLAKSRLKNNCNDIVIYTTRNLDKEIKKIIEMVLEN